MCHTPLLNFFFSTLRRGTARVTPPASLLVAHTAAEPFNPEELVAMLLEDAAAAGGGEKPESCAVTVPPWWTQQQRNAMLDAAHIAGEVVGLTPHRVGHVSAGARG